MGPCSFNNLIAASFVWFAEYGFGFFPVRNDYAPYDKAYFEKYQQYEQTETGRKIDEARTALVNKYYPGSDLIDIGIGSGSFLKALGRGAGFDVNPHAMQWLKERCQCRNPYMHERPEAVTCWDSLEHMSDPGNLLRRVTKYLFVSLPIFTGPDHVLRSKHFRKDEHFWYFTEEGFIYFMAEHGFTLVEANMMETEAGREDIGTFVFKRGSI